METKNFVQLGVIKSPEGKLSMNGFSCSDDSRTENLICRFAEFLCVLSESESFRLIVQEIDSEGKSLGVEIKEIDLIPYEEDNTENMVECAIDNDKAEY